MQDIGGLRAVVSSLPRVRALEKIYRERSFAHELIGSKDYIHHPKSDGYRSVHLIFRYRNRRAPAYNGLSLELQLRTKLQHAWATAIYADAITATKSLDDGKLADYIRATTFKTIMGDIKFGTKGEWEKPGMLQVQYHGIKQGAGLDVWRGMDYQIVLTPGDLKTGDVIYPYEKAK